MNYSFATNNTECPECGVELLDGVVVTSGEMVFTTSIGEEGSMFRGYLLDENADACTLVLSDPKPGIKCKSCGADIAAIFDRNNEEP